MNGMVIAFTITDAETGQPIDGVVIWTVFGSTFYVPFANGAVEIPSSGSFKGFRKDYAVVADGYVSHEDFFYQHDGRTFDVKLYRFADAPWIIPPEPPTPEQPQAPSLLKILPVVMILSQLFK